MTNVLNKIYQLGLSLPDPVHPIASYVPATISGNFEFTSGQLTVIMGKIIDPGILDKDLDIEKGKAAARVCVLNGLSAIRNLIGDLDKISKIIKVVGYVASDPSFVNQPAVVNGASDLILDIFGENGRHARTSIGVASLPLNSPVEIEMIVEIK
jgi:enamine deaminase RidA (YjgF/YER057c/UK114 family)